MNPPRLETDRLVVQPLSSSDAKALFAYRAHPDVARFQSLMFKNEWEALQFIQSHEGRVFSIPNTWFQLGIYLKPEEKLIGDIGGHFLDANFNTLEIGYTIAPAHQRKGYAFEAVNQFLAYLFHERSTSTIIGITDSRNLSSIRLLIKLGFERTDPKSMPYDFELLPDELIFTLSQVM